MKVSEAYEAVKYLDMPVSQPRRVKVKTPKQSNWALWTLLTIFVAATVFFAWIALSSPTLMCDAYETRDFDTQYCLIEINL